SAECAGDQREGNQFVDVGVTLKQAPSCVEDNGPAQQDDAEDVKGIECGGPCVNHMFEDQSDSQTGQGQGHGRTLPPIQKLLGLLLTLAESTQHERLTFKINKTSVAWLHAL